VCEVRSSFGLPTRVRSKIVHSRITWLPGYGGKAIWPQVIVTMFYWAIQGRQIHYISSNRLEGKPISFPPPLFLRCELIHMDYNLQLPLWDVLILNSLIYGVNHYT
jgi:hypothetical protein